MFCIASFLVLSILGIFSASNRQLAKEALDCVLRRVTFRPCTTGFDQKMKAKLVGGVLTRSETAAGFINKNFEIIAWVFVVLLAVSSFFAIRGIYNFYVYGSCNGLNQSGFCAFDPKGTNNAVSTIPLQCSETPPTAADLTVKEMDLTLFPQKNKEESNKLVFIGCYACDYSRLVYPVIMKLIERFPVNFVFAHYPVKEKSNYLSLAGECVAQQDPEKLWALNDTLFTVEKSKLEDESYIQETVSAIGVDLPKFNECLKNPATEEKVKTQIEQITQTGIFGTPTVFINGDALVGPKPFRVYAIKLAGFFYWLKYSK
jgi:protein-disulfide isomerase